MVRATMPEGGHLKEVLTIIIVEEVTARIKEDQVQGDQIVEGSVITVVRLDISRKIVILGKGS